MSSGQETFVQVALDGAGKKIRQLKLLQIIQADGTVADVHQQIVLICDENGDPVNFDDSEYKFAVLKKLDLIAELLSELVGGR